ncbi:bifunctional 2-polyprenyl-6-hydroxyphenol methylase/3-demethylubiquinol 3-O-methyltransferase UbiG [Carboxylicivirga sp. M1479]|uniref:class I SAM-dependent methyltransferase n=1 Tax=Carboxylicivirga sp. M1479 TaxID=2594476 RepID=UPI001177D467|nr:class I SAM-dependent methyltransferase [Carboxylicivirga sp. M1479]TRX71847.1 methyltransferase domain-containing protein [Carboxylicivirga sp. M1479]
MKEFWDDRYSQDEFAYGAEPNEYIKEKLPLLKPGKVLFPAEGEGRNSVYAAQLGWEVCAFDFSAVGKKKADALAASKGVSINYQVKGFLEEEYEANEFDAICLTFVHFHPDMKMQMHKRLDSYLKVGGYIIMDAFSKEHREINKVNEHAGGPPNADMMYSIEEIKSYFDNYDFIELKKELVHLQEGFGHVGEGSVIRFVGKKKFNK